MLGGMSMLGFDSAYFGSATSGCGGVPRDGVEAREASDGWGCGGVCSAGGSGRAVCVGAAGASGVG
jgi:hypothetical protein